MSRPSVTIRLDDIPESLREKIENAANKTECVRELLRELVHHRGNYDVVASCRAQAHATSLDLRGCEEKLRQSERENAKLTKKLEQVEQELNDKQRRLEMKDQLSKVQKKEARKALNHAISLVNYLGRVEPQ
jgi:chromosome segregation ATPase